MNNLVKSVKRFLVSEDGPTAVEYAVMLALIIVVWSDRDPGRRHECVDDVLERQHAVGRDRKSGCGFASGLTRGRGRDRPAGNSPAGRLTCLSRANRILQCVLIVMSPDCSVFFRISRHVSVLDGIVLVVGAAGADAAGRLRRHRRSRR
jgi:hypothetical protein